MIKGCMGDFPDAEEADLAADRLAPVAVVVSCVIWKWLEVLKIVVLMAV
jgi:hypothetical protein